MSEDEQIAQESSGRENSEVEYLEGATFKLYKGTEEIGRYTTGADGTITIEGFVSIRLRKRYRSDIYFERNKSSRWICKSSGYKF